MQIELADPDSPEPRRLLRAHANEMAARYGGGGSWEGVDGRKDVLWLARDGSGDAIGCVALRELGAEQVEVKHLYVVPTARRRGVGSALMDALEAEAGRRVTSIVLETGVRQPESIALYRKRSYRPRPKYEGADICGDGALYFER